MKTTIERELQKAAEFENKTPLFTESELLDIMQNAGNVPYSFSSQFWNMTMIVASLFSATVFTTLLLPDMGKEAPRQSEKNTSEFVAKHQDSTLVDAPAIPTLPTSIKGETLYSPMASELERLGIAESEDGITIPMSMSISLLDDNNIAEFLNTSPLASGIMGIKPQKFKKYLAQYGYDTSKQEIAAGFIIHASEYSLTAELVQFSAFEEFRKFPQPILIIHDAIFRKEEQTKIFLTNSSKKNNVETLGKAARKLLTETEKTLPEQSFSFDNLMPIKIEISGSRSIATLWYETDNYIRDIFPNYIPATPQNNTTNQNNDNIVVRHIAPNPATVSAVVNIVSLSEQTINAAIYSIDGKLAASPMTFAVKKGESNLPLHFSLQTGMYMVAIVGENGIMSTVRLVVQQ